MSESANGPEQLNLPFDAEDKTVNTARIFSLSEHRQRAQSPVVSDFPDINSGEEISRALERKILDEVLAEAGKLPWYK